jgi:hypothetical protein
MSFVFQAWRRKLSIPIWIVERETRTGPDPSTSYLRSTDIEADDKAYFPAGQTGWAALFTRYLPY